MPEDSRSDSTGIGEPVFELDIRPFGAETLYGALRSDWQTTEEVAQHPQAQYLLRYLNFLGAKSIVVEREYTDADYLDDVANYYIKSFEQFDRRCRRLHFFSKKWGSDQLRAALLSTDAPPELQRSYLGFVVARPLPDAIIGRTVLVTYPHDEQRRHYPTTRLYTAHLYGAALSVKSLAFQEQDTVLAACATVSLWSAFQKTAVLFNTAMPTPARITQAATASVFSTRPLPSHGLALQQMARAVREVGLEPEVFHCKANVPLLSLLVSHMELGVPPVLGLDIEGVGLHAVAVTGYSLRATPQHEHEDMVEGAPRRVGLRVDELYVHDDGHGPFARIKACTGVPKSDDESAVTFKGSWKKPGTDEDAVLRPLFVLVPVYHKIRLKFLDVQQWLTKFMAVVECVMEDVASIEWAISLTTTNHFKLHLKTTKLPATEIARVLFTQQPRFLWRATMTVAYEPVVEIVFDATGMARSQPACDMLFYDQDFRERLKLVVSVPEWETVLGSRFLAFLKAHAG